MFAVSRHRNEAYHVSCFLKDVASRPFVWGHTDCALVIADWMISQGRNYDPAELFRGKYRTEEECSAILREHGGLLRIFRRIAKELDLSRVYEFRPGDVGVVRVYRQDGTSEHISAIRTPSGRWAMKCTHGVMILTKVKVVAAWRI